MISLLSNIGELNSVVNVILLSNKGEILYDNAPFSLDLAEKKMIIWKGLLSILKKPSAAEFEFENGLYLVHGVELGYLIVGLSDRSDLDDIRSLSLSLQSMLTVSDTRKKALLQILFYSHDMLKPQIIEELNSLADNEVAVNLLSLLYKEKDFHSFVKDKLLNNICKTLGQCGAVEALGPLKKFSRDFQSSSAFSDRVFQTLQVSIRQLEIEHTSPKNEELSSVDPEKRAANNSKPRVVKKEKNLLWKQKNKIELIIRKLLKKGRKEEAVLKLMELIKVAAKQRNFSFAEELRNKLIEVDSMLLTEIIRAAEIIEEEKKAAIDPNHLEVWRALASVLSQEEFSSIYHMLEIRDYPRDELIVQQGDFFSKLLLVNKGDVQVFVNVDGMELVLKTAGPGEIIGTNPFFESSVWTANVRSKGTNIFLLSKKNLAELEEKFPALEPKLIDFCTLFTSGRSEFLKTKRSRRQHRRKKTSGKVTVTMLENGKNGDTTFKGDFFDISRGGMSFCMYISNRKKANALFGEKIKVTIPMGNDTDSFVRTGMVVAVRGHHLVNNEYSVHVVLDELLAPLEMQKIT